MARHELFFLLAVGFVGGTVAGGLGVPPLGALLCALCALTALLVPSPHTLRVPVLVVMLSAAIGITYYAVADYRYYSSRADIANATQFEGRVIGNPRNRGDAQIAKIEVLASSARLYLYTEAYPNLEYGDLITVSGEVVPPPSDSYGAYMAKERMHGTMFYPEVRIDGNQGNVLFRLLYTVHKNIRDAIARYFSISEAAFLSGILLGERDDFTKEFLDKLSVSGTMHLTALSGLHMTIIVFLAIAVFFVLFRGNARATFTATFITIALFVAMTGFKVSAVRASLMAFLIGLATQTGRSYAPRNAIAFAALVITVFNPKAPVYDIGFQLSFAATLSIIYLVPVLQRIPVFQEPGFLAWRSVLVITMAAQLGVAPITMVHFSNFSLTALPANVAILIVIPILMALGFATIAASFIFPPLAHFLAKPTSFLIQYATGIVETFATVRLMFNPEIGVGISLLYYILLLWVCWRFAPNRSPIERDTIGEKV